MVYIQPLWHKAIKFGEIKQNKGYYAIQGHRSRYQSKDRMWLPISDL